MSATCRTCGGADGLHKPSVLDPNGVSNAGHAMPLGHVDVRPPEPFDHTHSAEEWDSYKTADGRFEIAVQYEDGQFKKLLMKGDGFDYTATFDEIEQIRNLLTALHAAVAGIHKRKDPQ